MPTYKLYYFAGRGYGELSRFIFSQAGVPFEDVRFTMDEWPEYKPKMKFGKAPELEVDGKERYYGSIIIARYLAEQFNLAGSNPSENSQIASIGEYISDVRTELGRTFFETDAKRKEEMEKKVYGESLPNTFKKLSELVTDGYLWKGKLTWLDMLFYTMMEDILNLRPDTLNDYPKLQQLMKNVETQPSIAKWIAERPKTEW